jgi:putative flavoprotein involved in K+ transport
MLRTTATRQPFRRGRSWSWAAARPVASSPRNCTGRAARWSWLAGGRRGCRGGPGGRDIVTWLNETSFFDTPLSALPSPAARLGANLLVTGQRGGHDLHYRTLQAMGVQLLGRLAGVEGHRASFAADLADSVAFGDARYVDIRKLLTEQLPTRGMAAPELPDPHPFHADPPLELDLTGFGVVIFTSGFRPDYTHWMRFPAFDAMGFPLTDNGESTVVPGLFFCGVHFLRKRKSSVLFGVGEDAAVVAQSIAHHRSQHHTAPPGA